MHIHQYSQVVESMSEYSMDEKMSDSEERLAKELDRILRKPEQTEAMEKMRQNGEKALEQVLSNTEGFIHELEMNTNMIKDPIKEHIKTLIDNPVVIWDFLSHADQQTGRVLIQILLMWFNSLHKRLCLEVITSDDGHVLLAFLIDVKQFSVGEEQQEKLLKVQDSVIEFVSDTWFEKGLLTVNKNSTFQIKKHKKTKNSIF